MKRSGFQIDHKTALGRRRKAQAAKALDKANKPPERQLQPKRRGLRARPDRKLQEWSRKVRGQDGNECKWPGLDYETVLAMPVNTIIRTQLVISPCVTGDKRIDPHHIYSRGRRPDKRYEVDAGICLCRTHHDWVGNFPTEAAKIGLLADETYEAAQKRRD